MTQESGTPPGFWERIQQMIDQGVAKAMRSGPLRNASISGGGGLTVGAGSKFQVKHPTGGQMLLAGIYDVNHGFDLGDGSYQPMLLLRRADGTLALSMYDPDPDVGGYQQFLAMWDRSGNIIFSDDTDSGQGLARPYVPFTFYRARSSDWPTTASATFETIYRARGPKQQPRLLVETWANCTDPAATAEVRIMVNGVQFGSTLTSTAGFVSGLNFGPAAVSGAHMSVLAIEVQARLATGGGSVQVGCARIEGRQS